MNLFKNEKEQFVPTTLQEVKDASGSSSFWVPVKAEFGDDEVFEGSLKQDWNKLQIIDTTSDTGGAKQKLQQEIDNFNA